MLTLRSVYLRKTARNCFHHLKNVSGRVDRAEERHHAGTASGGDQLSENQGDATVTERW